MASQAPLVFDESLAAERFYRCLRRGYVDVLLKRTGDDLLDRLSVISRDFNKILDVGTPTSLWLDLLQKPSMDGPLPTHGRGKMAHGWARMGGTWGRVLEGQVEPVSGQCAGLLEALSPHGERAYDLVISGLALQGVNDLPGVLSQVRRTLKPDGLFIGALLGGRTLHELREAFMMAQSELMGGVSPRVAPFADVRDMGMLLQRAGFALPVTDVDTVQMRYAHPLMLMKDLQAMGLTNVLTARARQPLRRDVLGRVCEVYFERFADYDGRVRATFDVVWFSGWVPHESQQKPLRPGSAQVSLKDVLGPRSGA
jgi:SAM-dependent methyltransferase